MPKILLCERHISEETPRRLVEAGFEVFSPKEEIPGVHEFDRSALIQTIKDLQPDILLTGFRHTIDEEILSLSPIKAVFTRTTGTDHITGKVEIIKLVGEELTDVVAVPELCLWAMLELLRRRGGQELKGKTLGVIGYGRIGQILAKYGAFLGMSVIFNDPHKYSKSLFTAKYIDEYGEVEESEELTPHKQTLDELLKVSDIVSLNISSTEENRGFFNKEKFDLMKQGSYFLNSARPWLVDNLALKENLESGKLAGAWVDFDLGFTAENLIQTNHIGGKTLESSIKTEEIIVNKILQWSKS